MKTLKLIIAGLVMALACAAQNQPISITGTPQPPVMTTVTQVGAQGSTLYCYWLVAVYTGGNSAPAGPACTSTANATLSSTNYDVVNWLVPNSPLAPVSSFVLLRTTSATPPTGACGCEVAAGISASAVTSNDQSNTLSAYSVATTTTSFQMYVDNSSTAQPVLAVKSGTLVGGLIDSTGALNSNTATSAQVSPVYAAYGTVTAAQLNAGQVIVPAVAGRTLKVLQYDSFATGAAVTTCTAIQLQDTAATVALSITIAAYSGANVMITTSTAPAAGAITYTTYEAALTAGAGLQLAKTGSNCAGLTLLGYKVLYTVN